jgi:DNA-binding transcriptional regulator PaaX
LRILGQKKVISLPELEQQITTSSSLKASQSLNGPDPLLHKEGRKNSYAITRSLKGLRDAGLVEEISSPQNEYARLTKEGRKKMHSLELDRDTTLVNTSWDGFWRIILLDLPENRKSERESLRYLLKKAGFVCLKNSAWISLFPFEHLFTNIKRDLGLTTEMVILTTNSIDETSEKMFFKMFNK